MYELSFINLIQANKNVMCSHNKILTIFNYKRGITLTKSRDRTNLYYRTFQKYIYIFLFRNRISQIST